MPYISRERQKELNPYIEALVLQLYDDEMGDLEYVLFILLQSFCKTPDTRKFLQMNSLVGVLETTKAEFIRRIMGPYEDLKLIDSWSEDTPED